ncbi:MAG: diaminopimelate epimerase, partial [Gammaproteobacteria bacterium]
MRLDFTKMQSLGNDFVVLDGVSQQLKLSSEIARKLADRHFGVGCDQILLAEPGESTDFRFRIFNKDGSEVEQCGNGARCMAWFLRQRGLS